VLAVFVVAVGGCSTQGLVLVQSDQLQNLKPTPYSTVAKVPVRVSWHARPLARGERYLVFLDQFPMPPGDSIRTLANDTCKATPGCPNDAYLQQNFVYPTRTNHVELSVFPLQGNFPVNDLYGLHLATIVIIDRGGVRLGEEFWTTTFFVPT
jgi:hypothetical protein